MKSPNSEGYYFAKSLATDKYEPVLVFDTSFFKTKFAVKVINSEETLSIVEFSDFIEMEVPVCLMKKMRL